MIIGIGTDIIRIERIKKAISRYEDKFLERNFSIDEIKAAEKFSLQDNKVAFFAKRFAGKEAFSKALGTGIRENITFANISILNNELGKPYVILHNDAKEYIMKNITENKEFYVHITLSDDHQTAISYVIIEV